jgi:hypothetical protein
MAVGWPAWLDRAALKRDPRRFSFLLPQSVACEVLARWRTVASPRFFHDWPPEQAMIAQSVRARVVDEAHPDAAAFFREFQRAVEHDQLLRGNLIELRRRGPTSGTSSTSSPMTPIAIGPPTGGGVFGGDSEARLSPCGGGESEARLNPCGG